MCVLPRDAHTQRGLTTRGVVDITPRRALRPRNIDHARTDVPALATFTVRGKTERAEDSEGNPTQLELIEIADGVSVADIQAATGCPFRVANGYGSRWLKPMMQVR